MTAFPAEPTPSHTTASLPRAEGASGSVAGRYGPSAILTPANALTLARIALSPVMVIAILRDAVSWTTFFLGFVLAFSDGLDGRLARRHGTTRSGAFLDPLADKVLVLGAMYALVVVDQIWVLPVILITIREIGISLYRTRFARQGLAVPARTLGKAKTIIQTFAVALVVFPPLENHPLPSVTMLWVAVILTYVSAAQYLLDGRSAATTLGHRTTRAA